MEQPPPLPPQNPYAAPQSVVADVQSNGELVLASRGMRLAGAIVDGIILMVLVVPMMFASGYIEMAMKGQQPSFAWQVGMGLGGFICFLLLNGYLLNRYGQTVAKKLLGMRIVDLNGNQPEFFRLVGLRYGVNQLINLVPVVNMIYGLVNALFIFREDHRCLHDHIAGTRVVLV